MTSNQSISKDAIISPNARIWDFSQIRENARIGANSIIGSYVYIDVNVIIGDNCKVQTRALIYDPSIIHDGVFIGPGAILTNDKNPRAIQKSGGVKQSSDWEKVGVEVFEGASIGSGAICIAPVKIGKWALVGAGAVVTKNVKNYALVVGNPARQVGWVGPAGVILTQISEMVFECPETLTRFEVVNSELHEIISE